MSAVGWEYIPYYRVGFTNKLVYPRKHHTVTQCIVIVGSPYRNIKPALFHGILFPLARYVIFFCFRWEQM